MRTGKRRHPHSSVSVDQLRLRMIRGDPLLDLADARREWVMRSLLKQVRWEALIAQCGLTPSELTQHLGQVRIWYRARTDAAKASHAASTPPSS